MKGTVAAELRDLCRAYVRDEPPAWRESTDPAEFLALARRHLLTPLLWSLLGEGPAGQGPLGAALHGDFYRAVARHAEIVEVATALLSELNRSGVPVIALKGAVLGGTVWRDPVHRPMRDVDLLVRREDVAGVAEAARRLGLVRFEERHSLAFDLRFGATLVLTRHPDNLIRPSVDLHWRLLEDWRYGDAGEAWARDVWQRAEAGSFAGVPVLVPGPADLLVHVASHLGFHHAYDGLLWHLDGALLIVRLGDRLPWESVIAVADRLGARTAVALALEAARVLFGVAAPPTVERRLSGGPRWRLARRLVLPRVLSLAPLGHLEHGLPLLLLDSTRACARALGRSLLPPPEWVRLRYDAAPWPRGYARHGAEAFRVLTRALTRPR